MGLNGEVVLQCQTEIDGRKVLIMMTNDLLSDDRLWTFLADTNDVIIDSSHS